MKTLLLALIALLFSAVATLADDNLKNWVSMATQSPIDDSAGYTLVTFGLKPFTTMLGRDGSVVATIRCVENTTSLYFSYDGGTFDAGNNKVTIRIDKRPAQIVSMVPSTNFQAVGLWSGSAAIPILKDMLDGTTMIVRVNLLFGSQITTEFDISGLDTAIAPLREACHW